jgi:hypothetical protein
MVTYKEIQEYVKKRYGHSIKTCWIAHMKELLGLPRRNAPNRISDNFRTNPCPKSEKVRIEAAFRHFGVI